jgi:hypothetical protein
MTIRRLTQSILKQHIEYNPKTGEFFRLPSGGKLMTDPYTHEIISVGEPCDKKTVFIDHIPYSTLDIIWLYHHGTRPTKQLTQIDHKRSNIKISNIRAERMPTHSRLPKSLTQQRVKELFFYDHKKGKLHWREILHEKRLTGTTDDETGYMNINVLAETHTAGRIAWLYMTGNWPLHPVRHMNTNASDYRWHNLYESINRRDYEYGHMR